VIQGLKHRQNCLLESPTGSGKSLALLCASLAWQRQEAARVEKYNDEIDARQAEVQARQQEAKQEERRMKRNALQQQQLIESTPDSGALSTGEMETEASTIEIIDLETTNDSLMTSDESATQILPADEVSKHELLTDDEDDFQPMKKSGRGLGFSAKAFDQENNENDRPLSPTLRRSKRELDPEIPIDNYVPEPATKKQVVPKIYFGTRTHKQISQITRELRKTQYRSTRSVILASRDHTCVNPLVERMSNKNEHCKELLDGAGCGFQTNARKLGSFAQLQKCNVMTGYDLEDFVEAGRREKACPYFATRHLQEHADIIFCPYNYLISPSIRRSMGIELENQILIFDEAHNMEDAAREASSFTICQDEIQAAMQDFEKVGEKGLFEPYAHRQLAQLMSHLSGWMDSHENSLRSLGFDSSGKFWNGTDVLAEFDLVGLTTERYQQCMGYMEVIATHRTEIQEQQKERGGRFTSSKENEEPELLKLTMKTTEDVLQIFTSLTARNGSQRDDFRVALLKNSVRRKRDNRSGVTTKEILSINIWCLNPAVAFQELKDTVHSIVLTSGTLSPMQSFQSELDCPFPIKLEASHVIDRNQVFAGVLGMGPNNIKLNGSFRNVETFQYQDELGQLVLRVCQAMPHGILCFFPSYRLLEKVSERWRSTGLWHQLSSVKQVLIEPRSGSADFELAISTFYDCNATPLATQTGAMFLAVCRGKVSEGIDFADNNARAVICIGIPFPNFKDLQVELKREYNQANRSRGLLPGADWYEIQAFRALNQALGRCIRHRFDWGAIILVDERYCQSPRYTQSLSKWVRSSVQNYPSWEQFMRQISYFRDNMLAKATPPPSLESSVNSGAYNIADSSLEDAPAGSAGNVASNFYAHLALGVLAVSLLLHLIGRMMKV
ncbi:unnamed protein product, partial [Allacma fusca]